MPTRRYTIICIPTFPICLCEVKKMSLRLQAGSPNDANREYVPMGIKGTDMTVNENGNNSQVYPAGLREYTGVLADGLEDRWYE